MAEYRDTTGYRLGRAMTRRALLALGAALGGAGAVAGRAGAAGPFAFASIDGGTLALDDWAGRPVLVVNTASRCAFTPQYAGLEALWDRYEGLGLTVLGVPSNDFGRQEPGSNEEIADFCASTYDVSFPMLAKAKVTGASAHPLFRWAREAGGRAAVPAWNFHKILVGRDGRFIAAFPSYVEPQSARLVGAVERALRTPAL